MFASAERRPAQTWRRRSCDRTRFNGCAAGVFLLARLESSRKGQESKVAINSDPRGWAQEENASEKGKRKIACEIKSSSGPSLWLTAEAAVRLQRARTHAWRGKKVACSFSLRASAGRLPDRPGVSTAGSSACSTHATTRCAPSQPNIVVRSF